MLPGFRIFLRLTCLFGAAAVACLAQDPTGTLQGQVSDPSSARVAHTLITVKNTATGLGASQE